MSIFKLFNFWEITLWIIESKLVCDYFSDIFLERKYDRIFLLFFIKIIFVSCDIIQLSFLMFYWISFIHLEYNYFWIYALRITEDTFDYASPKNT